MTARTHPQRYVLAQAVVRAGVLHVAAERTTGTYFSVCGAGQIRSREIAVHTAAPTDLTAMCPGCAALAVDLGGSVDGGLALILGAGIGAGRGVALVDVPITAVLDDETRPRRTIDGDLETLAASIAAHGVLQPILLRRTATGLALVAGRRRLAAAALAGLATIPAVLRETSDEQAVLDALTENLHRADLDPIDQAHAFQRALAVLGIDKQALADRLGISRAHVSNTIRLLGLPEPLREQVASGALSAAHGRSLLRLTNHTDRDALAAQIVAQGMSSKAADTAARALADGPDPLAEVARLLTGLLDAKVEITAAAGRRRIVIDVPDDDLARVLEQLGVRAAAVA